jgi:hypothetical protein
LEGFANKAKDEASIVHPTFSKFHVITSRKNRMCPESPGSFCNATVHTANVLGITADGNSVLEESAECEYLADAVEDLWEKVLETVGE